MPTLDAAWRDWLTLNTQRGCSADSMLAAMLRAGIDAFSAQAALAERIPAMATATAAPLAHAERGGGAAHGIDAENAADIASGGVRGPSGQSPIHARTAPSMPLTDAAGSLRSGESVTSDQSGAYRYDPAPIAAGNLIRAGDRDVKVLMRSERPQLVVFGDVLTPDECGELIERSRHSLRRSTTINADNGNEDVIQNRTSEGLWFQRCQDELIERLDRRIASLMNWPLENGEGFQILHYRTGGEYRPHFDYFSPDQAGSAKHTARGGQRVATLIMYLNDVPNGGETIFPKADISVAPRQGGAVYFRYMNGDGQLDPLSLHGGAPVLGGEKWIMTKWMRERAYV